MVEYSGEITSFHAHIYFDATTRAAAARVRDGLAAQFDVELGRWHEQPIGPHPQPMYQVKFMPSEFGTLVPWLMLHHENLPVLIHPNTGDEVGDHTHRALWLGEKLPLNITFLEEFARAQRQST